jgi:hypothetical protein
VSSAPSAHEAVIFFNEDQPVYRQLAEIHKLRSDQLTLRRGRQFLRQISGDSVNFGFPEKMNGRILSIVPWSRIFNDNELLCAINKDPDQDRTAFVTIDHDLHTAGGRLTCLYSTRPAETGRTLLVEARNGKAVSLTAPSAGFVVYG